jgi:hypothetical protein
MKITNGIVGSYLNCRYKAFLALKGEIGTPHDYEVLMNELAEEYRPRATDALLRQCKLEDAPRISSVTLADLQQGHELILDCAIETDQFQFHFDALRKLDEKSSRGPSHYTPVMFCHEDAVRVKQKLLLSCGAYLLRQVQGGQPKDGLLISGASYRATNVGMGCRRQT